MTQNDSPERRARILAQRGGKSKGTTVDFCWKSRVELEEFKSKDFEGWRDETAQCERSEDLR
jgi:hypothetical protein